MSSRFSCTDRMVFVAHAPLREEARCNQSTTTSVVSASVATTCLFHFFRVRRSQYENNVPYLSPCREIFNGTSVRLFINLNVWTRMGLNRFPNDLCFSLSSHPNLNVELLCLLESLKINQLQFIFIYGHGFQTKLSCLFHCIGACLWFHIAHCTRSNPFNLGPTSSCLRQCPLQQQVNIERTATLHLWKSPIPDQHTERSVLLWGRPPCRHEVSCLLSPQIGRLLTKSNQGIGNAEPWDNFRVERRGWACSSCVMALWKVIQRQRMFCDRKFGLVKSHWGFNEGKWINDCLHAPSRWWSLLEDTSLVWVRPKWGGHCVDSTARLARTPRVDSHTHGSHLVDFMLVLSSVDSCHSLMEPEQMESSFAKLWQF